MWTRDVYTHVAGSQFAQAPEARTLDQLRYHKVAFRLLALGAIKELSKRLGFSFSKEMLDEAFERILVCYANQNPTLLFETLTLDSRGTSLMTALREKLIQQKEVLEQNSTTAQIAVAKAAGAFRDSDVFAQQFKELYRNTVH